MARHEKEARQPFLHGNNDEDSGDDSIELPELDDGNTQLNDLDKPDCPSIQGESEYCKTFPETSTPPKKPATYAILFMLGAQIFSASMNVSIRSLENAATHLHPLQVCTAHQLMEAGDVTGA